MADGISDVKQADLGQFLNASAKIGYKLIIGIFVWLKSVIVFILTILMVLIVAVLKIIPMIYSLLGKLCDLVLGLQFPTMPTSIPGADFLNIANTFFPIDILFSALATYYILCFTMFAVDVIAGICKFGFKWTIEVIKACLP